MARAKTKSATKAKSRTGARGGSSSSGGRAATRGRSRNGSTRSDAISLLKQDHRQVEDWFEQFEKSRKEERKRELATNICNALRVHTVIEEEVFYPSFLEATQDEDLHHEAEIEHDGAKKLIAEIEASGPDDDYYDARVSVLSEMIKHHVREEEKPDGMFAKARSSGMDLQELGEQMAARKAELEASPDRLRDAGRNSRSAGRSLIGRLTSSG